VVAAGRRLLEEEGPEALTMRRLAERVGIRAPSLYKHLPDKAALAAAYRRFALEHPHLYRLMNNGPLPREHLPPGLENRTAAPLLRAAGSQARARAVWAFAHGMVLLELDQRFPPEADLDAAWHAGIAAFQAG
jgi:AcrR family transcriptional regulator